MKTQNKKSFAEDFCEAYPGNKKNYGIECFNCDSEFQGTFEACENWECGCDAPDLQSQGCLSNTKEEACCE